MRPWPTVCVGCNHPLRLGVTHAVKNKMSDDAEGRDPGELVPTRASRLGLIQSRLPLVIVVAAVTLAVIVALSLIGTSPPALYYHGGGSAIQ